MNDYKTELLADVSTGTSLALINDWGIIGANVTVILLRLIIEFLILKIRKSRKNERMDKV